MQIPGTVSCTNGLRQQNLLSNLKGKVRVGTYLQNVPYFNSFSNLQKITDAANCVYPSLREAVANYVCQLYRGEVNPYNFDHIRMDIFSHKMRDVVRLPPTIDAMH